jgi:hypothetical protein
MRLRHILLMSLPLVFGGCATVNPPCNRADVTPAYDEHGQPRTDAMTFSNACVERILGDLHVCYKEAR